MLHPIDNVWRNIQFSELTAIEIQSTHRTNLGHESTPWTPCPPSDNFWAIVEYMSSGEFRQVSFGADDYQSIPEYQRGNHWCSQRHYSNSFNWIRRDESIFNLGTWQHYKINIGRSAIWRATVPEGDSIRFYFGADYIYVASRGEYIRANGNGDLDSEWDSWTDYFDEGGFMRGAWSRSEVFKIIGEQESDTVVGKVCFKEYLKKTSAGAIVNGQDWLPDPTTHDSLIGVVFSCTSPDSTVTNRMAYEIFEVTQWHGQDMNTPRTAPEPCTQDSTYFDFHVHNPMYGNDPKYTVTTICTDDWEDWAPQKGGGKGGLVSTRRYSVERNDNAKGDTLWLIARDYAPHCVIIPRGLRTPCLRLREHYSVYDTTEVLWAVTVPRDYDGWPEVGMNKGDFMADQWEEDVLNVSIGSDTVWTFHPFVDKDSHGIFRDTLYADSDTIPSGRNIDGDRLTNWEEYRGFHLTGDLDSVEYAQSKHVRLNPLRKTVLNDWRKTELHVDVQTGIPAMLDSLNNYPNYPYGEALEILFIDSKTDEPKRLRNKRVINQNQIGAFSFYFGYPYITNRPAQRTQNAVTWWIVNRAEMNWYQGFYRQNLRGSGDYGYCVFPNRGTTLPVPFLHSRTLVFPEEIQDAYLGSYYQNPTHTPEWDGDYKLMIKCVMSHEFGHCIGMFHVEDHNLMSAAVWPVDSTTGQFFGDTLFVKDYSDSSWSEITVRAK